MPWAEGAHAKLWPAAFPLFLRDPSFGDRIPPEFHSASTHKHLANLQCSPRPAWSRGVLDSSWQYDTGEPCSARPATQSLVRWSRHGWLAVLRLQSLIFSLQAFVIVLQGGMGGVKLLELAFEL